MADLTRRGLLGGLGALAPGLVLPPRLLGARTHDAAAIWQRTWDLDQAGNGVPALRPGDHREPQRGWVLVEETSAVDESHRVFADVHIPDHKQHTYDLARQLFDSYRLDQTKPDPTTAPRAREIERLLDAVEGSGPLAVAREHLERVRGEAFSDQAWRVLLDELWFRTFDDGRNRDLSGFEHVMVGEQRRGAVGGYHFWYKYWLDDHPEFLGGDNLDYHGTQYGRLQAVGHEVPEILTIGFRWHARDFGAGESRPLFKPVSSFWVGCSVEGLMALGTLRFFARGPAEAKINGARYALEMYRSPDGQSIRTFYPRFLGRA